MLVTLGIIFTIGIIFSPVFAKVIILIVAAGHFYYFLCRIKTVEEQENMETAIVYISANSSYAMDLFRVQPTAFLIK